MSLESIHENGAPASLEGDKNRESTLLIEKAGSLAGRNPEAFSKFQRKVSVLGAAFSLALAMSVSPSAKAMEDTTEKISETPKAEARDASSPQQNMTTIIVKAAESKGSEPVLPLSPDKATEIKESVTKLGQEAEKLLSSVSSDERVRTVGNLVITATSDRISSGIDQTIDTANTLTGNETSTNDKVKAASRLLETPVIGKELLKAIPHLGTIKTVIDAYHTMQGEGSDQDKALLALKILANLHPATRVIMMLGNILSSIEK